MKKNIVALLLFIASSVYISGQENIYISGYGELNGLMAVNDFSDIQNDELRFGSALSTLFRLELSPLSGITAVLEGRADFSGGYANPLGRYETTGLPLVDSDGDFNSDFSITQAWAAWQYEALNISFGLIPISWGSAWMIHPSDRVNRRNLSSLFSDEKEGVPSLTADLALGWNFGFSGYLCLTDKSGNGLVSLDETDPENLPFGLKFMAYPTGWEISAGFIREVIISDSSTRNNWIISDITGNLWDFGITAEAGLLVPNGSSAWKLKDSLELSLGLSYLFEPIDLEFLVEYTHLGAGETESLSYNVSAFLEGSALFSAEDYLFAHLSWKRIENLTLELANVINLNDGSFLLIPAAEWEPLSDIVFSLGVYFAFGNKTSEFGGERILGPGLSWRPWDDVTVFCGMKVFY